MIKRLLIWVTILSIAISAPFSVSAQDTYQGLDKEKINEGKKVIKEIIAGKSEIDLTTGEIIDPELKRQKNKDSMIYPQFVSGGGNHSHQYLVACAIDMLDSDGKTNAANYLYSYYNEAVAYADWPDVYESDNFTFLGHFWHAYTHVNYLEQTSPTAMSRFKYYMGLANTYFDKNSSNNSLAIQYLGKALHYFSDLNAPHHVTNLIAVISRHSEWENYADANRTSYRKYSGTLYNNFGTNFEGYGQDAAYNGAKYVNYAESTNTSDMSFAARKTYEYCQDSLAAVIDAFFRTEGVY